MLKHASVTLVNNNKSNLLLQCTVQGKGVIEIWAQQEETCRDAADWVKRVAYPCVSTTMLVFAYSTQTFQFFIVLGTDGEDHFLPICANQSKGS